MAFDVTALTGAVNKYLNSISDTAALSSEEKDSLSPEYGEIFRKYLSKAIDDELGTNSVDSDSGIQSVMSADALNIAGTVGLPDVKDVQSENAKKSAPSEFKIPDIKSEVDRVFMNLDIEGQIRNSMEAHSRFNDRQIGAYTSHVDSFKKHNKGSSLREFEL
ncbi:MAG: hypothetical protein J5802_05310 [Butyrivibrio sp.]|nr:hypothetical protein [Butyrivibrio sp.]